MTKVLVWGAEGRMGRAIVEVIAALDTATVVGTADADQSPDIDEVDVVIDFSTPNGFSDALAFAGRHGAAFVSGTTGLDSSNFAQLDAVAGRVPVLWAANMSLGVAVTRALVRQAAAALPTSFAPELVELHHRHKVDAPSGTAIALAEEIERARDTTSVFGREGLVGAREPQELGLHAVRGGDVVGEHTVYFLGEGERIEIRHQATDRAIFARGAVAAALWLAGRPAKRYTIDDVLGL